MKKAAYLNMNDCDKIGYDRTKVKGHPNVEIMELDEFAERFNRDQISDLGLLVFFDEETPEEKQQKRIEAAAHYLCETTDDDGKEVSLADQIALIEAADEDAMLSDIENVLEWEAIQGRFTAAEFLDLIG